MTLFIVLLLSAPSIGSFLGVLIARLPLERDVIFEKSRCDSCGVVLRWWELVPVLGWILLRGRCARCGTAVPALYPAVELSAVAIVLSAALVARGWYLGFYCIAGWVLLVPTVLVWRARAGQSMVKRALLFSLSTLGWVIWLAGLYLRFSAAK